MVCAFGGGAAGVQPTLVDVDAPVVGVSVVALDTLACVVAVGVVA